MENLSVLVSVSFFLQAMLGVSERSLSVPRLVYCIRHGERPVNAVAVAHDVEIENEFRWCQVMKCASERILLQLNEPLVFLIYFFVYDKMLLICEHSCFFIQKLFLLYYLL